MNAEYYLQTYLNCRNGFQVVTNYLSHAINDTDFLVRHRFRQR